MAIAIAALPGVQVSAEECAALLRRVLESRELRRAVRLRDLLQYIGTRQAEGALSLREQEVGEAVFGRPTEYDTSLDNIVRVTVSELRKRLARYFADEGAAETIVLEVPRGGYLPVYLRRSLAVETVGAVESLQGSDGVVVASESSEPVASSSARDVLRDATRGEVARNAQGHTAMWLSVLAVLVLLAGAACAVLQRQNHALRAALEPWKSDPTVEAFWSQFFASGREVDIVAADASYALEEDLLRRTISLDDYLDYKYKSLQDDPAIDNETRATIAQLLNRNNGSIGDFQVAERILKLAGDTADVHLTSARSYTPESIRRNNMVLIGGRASNPWVELFHDQMDFYPAYDPVQHLTWVIDRAPQRGEQAQYTAIEKRDQGYSVVAFLPSERDHGAAVQNGGDQHNVLIIAGTDSQATRAAGDFITSREGIAAIRQRLPASQYPYFQVLLGSSRMVGTTLHTEMLAVRGHAR